MIQIIQLLTVLKYMLFKKLLTLIYLIFSCSNPTISIRIDSENKFTDTKY